MKTRYDLIIIGTGAGGGTLAYALKDAGMDILLVERGDFLPQERQNWEAEAVFAQKRYKADESWYDAEGRPYQPGVHYFVGGNTKVYGAALPRMRPEDFGPLAHEGGLSPAWPIAYEELEPYYARAEEIYKVHGAAGEDPTDGPRSTPYPYPALAHEPYIARLKGRLEQQGLHPVTLPLGIDLHDDGRCIRCATCDGFPCQLLAKSDADTCCVRPALATDHVTLSARTYARRLLTKDGGRTVSGIEVEKDGETFVLEAGMVVVACGAVNSAALFLRSGEGFGNRSGQVGRNYMVHNNTALTAIHPLWHNDSVFQKTLTVNDFYLQGPGWPYPLGNLQLIGKLQAGMLTIAQPLVPRPLLQAAANRSVDWWVMSEDLPDPENRVTLKAGGAIQVHWTPNNLASHQRLIAEATRMLKAAGYPFVFTQGMGIDTNSHQCGTLRFGEDPATSVLDPYGKAHDFDNLYVVDASFFPSSTAVNPALTIAAQALRVAEHLQKA